MDTRPNAIPVSVLRRASQVVKAVEELQTFTGGDQLTLTFADDEGRLVGRVVYDAAKAEHTVDFSILQGF